MFDRFLFAKVLKYEFRAISRSSWIAAFFIFNAIVTFVVQKISADFQKTILTLSTLLVVFVPLITSFFTSLYWYYNERFSQLLATQPVPRSVIYFARYAALTISLSLCFSAGLLLGSLATLHFSAGLLLLCLISSILTAVFVALSMMLTARIEDRLQGMGVVFAIWMYFVFVHDAILLLVLLGLRDYPLDLVSGTLGSINPVGLSRVFLLVYNDGALLLGHTGALVREFMTSWMAYAWAGFVSMLWALVPLLVGSYFFKTKDFT